MHFMCLYACPLFCAAGAMLFNKRFTSAWAADGYRDYLSPEQRPLESGKTVLSRLLGRGGEAHVMQVSSSSGGERV